MTDVADKTVTSAHRAWPLYGAAFATAVALSVCWTAMPFVLTGMNGTEAHVGYALAANSLAYMVALLLTGSLLGHLNVKRATCLATAVALGAALMMLLAVTASRWQADGSQLTWIWTIIVAGGLGGASMALYWPFLMSWVSARYEGVELNRRFGRYNGAWSGGALIGPKGMPRNYAGSFEKMPVFIGGSDVDPWVSHDLISGTAAVFQKMGAKVDFRTYPGMAHTVNQDEIESVRAMLKANIFEKAA